MMNVNELRDLFIDYFKKHNHIHIASSPLVPHNDPSLMFTNAGMVQFKNLFTGLETREYQRAVTSQKCVRAGGKHNDLENVGYTARHHTFFEMLGNFSFGDYFKDVAIELAWNFITKALGLSKNRLYVTIYVDDDEAYTYWQKIAGLSSDRIIRIATSDNFWSMGDTGPCGPCSEIYYDHGDHIYGGLPGTREEDGDRFVEVWNLVFMQFEQLSDGMRINLPKPSIDTGMGLERISAVVQGTHDNYETDLFKHLIESCAKAAHLKASDATHQNSYRVIADHLRSSSFLIADGVLPSNEGRGYVLRRIMRRAMRHAHILGCKEPLMHQLVPSLIEEMGGAYPELKRAEALITETLYGEETRFQKTLQRGLKLLQDEIATLGPDKALPGRVAFKLYDTYGFPIDLTADILRGQKRNVDMAGFETAMAQQKEEARKSWSGSGEAAIEKIWFDLIQEFGPTEFLGYQQTRAQATIIALIDDKTNQRVETLSDSGWLITNQTPFYGESGGQAGDIGVGLRLSDKAGFTIVETNKYHGQLIVHGIQLAKGITLHRGDSIELAVNQERRLGLMQHHSATHLLHQALRNVLGAHVVQKGSLVLPDRLRFDFTHPKALTDEELYKVEALVNTIIQNNAPTQVKLMSPEEAVQEGALALFGEKYGDEVRVVSMGLNEDNATYSVELCGGTHIHATGDIGQIKITGESAIASGVRRIEAVAGMAALNYTQELSRCLKEAGLILKTPEEQLVARIKTLLEQQKTLEKQLTALRKTGSTNLPPVEYDMDGFKLVAVKRQDVPAKELKGLADSLRTQYKGAVIILTNEAEGKVSIVINVSPSLVQSLHINAVDLVRKAADILGGKGGGGRADMAQAGGTRPDAIHEAIEAIKDMLQQQKAA